MNMFRFSYARFLVALALLGLAPAACSTSKQVGASVALPFAAVGDTAVAPFTAMGKASEALVQRGYEVDHFARGGWGAVEYVQHDNPADLFYYIPGYSLYPFQAFSQYDYYGMTTKCMDTVSLRRPSRRDRVRY
jgi:hypothetical protein